MTSKRKELSIFSLEKEEKLIDKIIETAKEIRVYDEINLQKKEEGQQNLIAPPPPPFAPGKPCIYTIQETLYEDIEKYLDKLNEVSPRLWHFEWGTLSLMRYSSKKIKNVF